MFILEVQKKITKLSFSLATVGSKYLGTVRSISSNVLYWSFGEVNRKISAYPRQCKLIESYSMPIRELIP